jgi:hypothetical protein
MVDDPGIHVPAPEVPPLGMNNAEAGLHLGSRAARGDVYERGCVAGLLDRGHGLGLEVDKEALNEFRSLRRWCGGVNWAATTTGQKGNQRKR